ncbi:TMV resistance protein N-like [Ipomoea triloba]|uniref:TMV resistance protein N-like n=1 Tax=Ipomoea triloba TaxID=35885 RepID=UPI00125E2FF3|nr:TMV resistance protein N-like [Ipomoea triloba]
MASRYVGCTLLSGFLFPRGLYLNFLHWWRGHSTLHPIHQLSQHRCGVLNGLISCPGHHRRDRSLKASTAVVVELVPEVLGKDTRHNFVHPLHEAFCLEGINAFKDDINLNKGDWIRQELFHVIETSWIAIPILSKDYATSAWHLRGSFAQAFAMHEIEHKDYPKKVRRWKQAVSEVAEISGFDLLNEVYKGDQSKCIHDITEEVQKKLDAIRKEEHKSIAFVEYHLPRLNSLLRMESPATTQDVLFLGIWETNNSTTILMKKIFNMFSDLFESVCLIQVNNLKKRGLMSLQKKLLKKVDIKPNLNVMNAIQGMGMIKQKFCLKKVLVILEGIDTLHQLHALVGSRNWFGSGSRIIITTSDKSVLIDHGMDILYEPTMARE